MALGAAATAGKAAAGAAGKKGFAAWYGGHKTEALLGAGGIVVTIALYVKSKNAAAGTSTAATATPSTSTVMPGTEAPDTGSYGNGGGDGVSGLSSILSGLSSQLTNLTGTLSGTGTGGTSPAPAASPTPTTYGEGIVPTAQGQMVFLGVTGAGGSTSDTYQVSGGAPVYFGNASSLATGGTTQQGVDVYTPIAYEGQVSAQAA
jgi:hypothetical protein